MRGSWESRVGFCIDQAPCQTAAKYAPDITSCIFIACIAPLLFSCVVDCRSKTRPRPRDILIVLGCHVTPCDTAGLQSTAMTGVGRQTDGRMRLWTGGLFSERILRAGSPLSFTDSVPLVTHDGRETTESRLGPPPPFPNLYIYFQAITIMNIVQ